ncbi:MAG: FitA-like ribbon-helix-helix domain-containing protein [Hyphomonas sp.]
MASLSVRQLDDETLAALRRRAAANGVSMEEEVRQILRAATKGTSDGRVGDRVEAIFRPTWTGERFVPEALPPFSGRLLFED